jgi:excisionase family DNA binding protein
MKTHKQNIEGRLLNSQEIADVLGVSLRTLSTMTRDKRIPYLKITKKIHRFDQAKVLKALNKFEVPVLN